jgi:hypothetical protein
MGAVVVDAETLAVLIRGSKFAGASAVVTSRSRVTRCEREFSSSESELYSLPLVAARTLLGG